jgi:hypothetical protein
VKHKTGPDPLHDKRRSSAEQAIKLFSPQDFHHDRITNTCRCPAGRALYSNGSNCRSTGRLHDRYKATSSPAISQASAVAAGITT